MTDEQPEASAALLDCHPSEIAGSNRYFDLIDLPSWWQLMLLPLVYPMLFKYRNRAVREVLDEITDINELKLILIANSGYFHTIPDTLSVLSHAYAQSYYRGGGCYIKGKYLRMIF